MRLWRLTLLCFGLTGPVAAQARDEQFYYPGGFNWKFLDRYPEAARLFNAFDYGHAVLYESLYSRPNAPAAELETVVFDFLVGDLLKNPPRYAIAEEAIQPSYAKLAARAAMMFHWAHVLHRQLYDVHSDPSLTPDQQHALTERLTDYYLSNRRYAFTDQPKAMELMDGQYYSGAFKAKYPKFNGLIWSYHWLQVGLYEPLISETEGSSERAGVRESVTRFWAMLGRPPGSMPEVMPMTAGVAPRFSELHPRAAVIFDNLHMLHDIISDILASDRVARADKAKVIAQALDEFQDGTKNVVSLDHWRMMAEHMGGVEKMGGVAGKPRP